MRWANRTILLAILAGLMSTGIARAETAVTKPVILQQLTRAGILRLPEQATRLSGNYSESTTQLEIDLIVFRRTSARLGMPRDIKNLDAIVAAVQKSLNDPVVNYAAELFSSDSRSRTALRPTGEASAIADDLDQLKLRIEDAIASRESSPAKAVESLASAARLCQGMHLELAGAAISKQLGDIHQFDMSRYYQAESFYHQASFTFQDYRCAESNAAVYDNWGLLSMNVGRYADSAEHYIQAARQWVDLIRDDPSQFRNRDKAGLAYMLAGKAKEAEGDYAAALELMGSRGLDQLRMWAYPTRSYELLIDNLITVAQFLRQRTRDSKEAILLLNEARDAALRLADPLITARVFEQLEAAYSAQGSAYAAPASAKRTKWLWNAALAEDSALARISSTPRPQLAELKACLNQVERAATAYQELQRPTKASELWRKAADAYGAAGLVDEQLSCLRSLALVFDAISKPNDSLACRMEAVAIATKTNRKPAAAEIVMSLVRTARELNQTETALEGLSELTALTLTTRNSRQAAEALQEHGELLVQLNHHEEALPRLSAAVDKFTTLVGDVWAAGRVALELAEAQTILKRPAEARSTLTSALAGVETIYGPENARPSAYLEHTKVVMDLYEALVQNHVLAGDTNGATGVLRGALRYSWFSDLMRDLRGASDAQVSGFASSNDLVRQEPDSSDTPGQSRQLAKDAAGYFTTCWKVERNYAANYMALPVKPLELYGARAGMPKGTAVIAYMRTDSCVYAFICARDRCAAWQLDDTGIDNSISTLREILETCEQGIGTGVPVPAMYDWQTPAFLAIKEPLTTLCRQLLTPIAESLEGIDRLVFALPTEFGSLPMAALISGEANGQPTFIIQKYQVSYLGEAMLNDLVGANSREIYPSLDSLAVFADPEDNLPGARTEAAAIKNAYASTRWYVGSGLATAANFLSECDRAKMIHLAAHHRLSGSPAGFEMILAPDSSSDGIIGVQELAGLKRDSLELVVLSACDTVGSSDPLANGPIRAAELFSLVAGAKSVLGALWKVSDDAASQIFREFYTNLARGKSRADSLRLAQLHVIESRRFAHPFYWACFALYGNPR